MGWLRSMVIWWRDATFSTLAITKFKGVPVGQDGVGNRYYRDKRDMHRWVVYCGTVDASRVPPDWHAWLHGLSDTPPQDDVPPQAWEKAYIPNLSGTAGAYRPSGSLSGAAERRAYEPWSPA